MLFNSLEFAPFLFIVFALYWLLAQSRGSQNVLILLSSLLFYGWWDWRFIGLLVFSTLLDYGFGFLVHGEDKGRKKFYLRLSIFNNLIVLAVFKYYNFFISETADFLTGIGVSYNPWLLNIALPVGISFYTFHGMSYVIDIYYGRFTPVKSFIDYSVFVCFFPLLVAGPIERATHLLPQIQSQRVFSFRIASDGLRQALWGFFKKIVIADTCAGFVNEIFGNYQHYNGLSLFLGALLFAFQIYADFSGYTDIALGISRLFGFELLRNFAFPYFSRDIAEFWRRWHISLSSWFRDYVYIPLGGSRVSKALMIRNTFIIFLLSGFWHGANWTYLAWGALNAIYFIPLLLAGKNRNNLDIIAQGRQIPGLKELVQMLITFFLTNLAWVYFRAQTIGQANDYLFRMFTLQSGNSAMNLVSKFFLLLLLAFVLVEWLNREKHHGLEISNLPKWIRWIAYLLVFGVIIFMGNLKSNYEFIYFQF
jgi:D-alanyl-lipoteichoic acid acyltransferase DltB (MBOAT superfamily)